MFSKSCEYGIKAITYIATQSLESSRVKIGDVANNIGSPEAFTAKILGALSKKNILESQTGPNGGFFMSETQMKQVKMSDLVSAIDGDSIYNGCALGLSECNDKEPCPMHDKFSKIREQLKTMLTTTTVYDLALGLRAGHTVLLRQEV